MFVILVLIVVIDDWMFDLIKCDGDVMNKIEWIIKVVIEVRKC